MNKPKYGNKIERYATVEQAKEHYKLSRNMLMELAYNEDAVIHIGRCVRVDIVKLDKALEKREYRT